MKDEMSERAPYQEPVPQPCPMCGSEFTPSGFWRGEVCSECTSAALVVMANNIKIIGRTYDDPYLRKK